MKTNHLLFWVDSIIITIGIMFLFINLSLSLFFLSVAWGSLFAHLIMLLNKKRDK